MGDSADQIIEEAIHNAFNNFHLEGKNKQGAGKTKPKNEIKLPKKTYHHLALQTA